MPVVNRAERLMNLHIMLLGARRFVPKKAIRRAHYSDYPDTAAGDEAFERAFERDKEALRSIGAAIEVGSSDPLFDDEVGYRIPSEQTSLPEVRLEPDEAAVLGLATRVWQNATLARAADRALAKLRAQGVEIDPDRLDVLGPSISADEPAFEPLWEAVSRRRQVTFDYQRGASRPLTRRRLQPWGLVRVSARWYVVGHDVDRGEERVFRLSRVVGPVKAVGKFGAYEVPEGTDVGDVARRLVPQAPRLRAEVAVRPGRCVGLRRRAVDVRRGEAHLGEPGESPPWDVVVVEESSSALADEVLGYGPDALVLGPSELREEVAGRLRALVEVLG